MKMTNNLLKIKLPDHAHVAIFALTGSGKSYLANLLANSQRNRNIIYKVNVGNDRSWVDKNTWDITDIHQNDQMAYIMQQEEHFPIIISDNGKMYQENLEYLWDFLLLNDLSAIVLFDEIQNYQEFAEIYTNEGRKHSITVIYTSIRPEMVKNVNITSNTSLFIFFALSPKMIKGIRDNYGIVFPNEYAKNGVKSSPVIDYVNDVGDGLTPIYKYHSVMYNYKNWYFLDSNYNVIDIL